MVTVDKGFIKQLFALSAGDALSMFNAATSEGVVSEEWDVFSYVAGIAEDLFRDTQDLEEKWQWAALASRAYGLASRQPESDGVSEKMIQSSMICRVFAINSCGPRHGHWFLDPEVVFDWICEIVPAGLTESMVTKYVSESGWEFASQQGREISKIRDRVDVARVFRSIYPLPARISWLVKILPAGFNVIGD